MSIRDQYYGCGAAGQGSVLGTLSQYSAEYAKKDAEDAYINKAQPPQPRFEQISDKLGNLPNAFNEAVKRIRNVADRFGGSIPEAVAGGQTSSPVPTSLASRLEASADDLEFLLNKLNEQIDRLERF